MNVSPLEDFLSRFSFIHNANCCIFTSQQISTDGTSKSSRLTKKHVLIAAVSLLSVGLIVTCVLVAIRIFTDSQIEIVKVCLFDEDFATFAN
jgi:hypothetical protein